MGISSSKDASNPSNPARPQPATRQFKSHPIDRAAPIWVYLVRAIILLVGIATIVGTAISLVNNAKTLKQQPTPSPQAHPSSFTSP
jgi:hypothetical protein